MSKKSLLLVLGVLLFGTTGYTQEKNISRDRPEMDLMIMQKQVNVKRMYREAYEQDNDVKFSTLEKLEYVIANNPGLDDDTMSVVQRGTALFRKMNFGMYQDDMNMAGAAIRKSPKGAMNVMSNLTRSDAETKDVLAVTDIMKASERMKEKMLKGDPLGSKGYQINIDDF